MKTVSAALAQHLAGEVTTLATCWKITRRDGVVLGFTDHVRDLEVDGVTYGAASGYTRTAIRSTADLAVDNLDVESVFADDGITEVDLRTGRYDFAEVRMFLIDYQEGRLICAAKAFAIPTQSRLACELHGVLVSSRRGLAERPMSTDTLTRMRHFVVHIHRLFDPEADEQR
jgi:hypothetical protein